jgi:hypothetical protein
MNDDTAGNGNSRRAGFLAVMTAVAVLAAACGGGASPPAGPAAGGSKRYQQALAYSECMRAHGVPNFPDPDQAGNIVQHVSGGQPPDNGPRAQAADRTCHHLLSGGGANSAGTPRRIIDQLLKLAQCMRAHGEPNFPDPRVSSRPPTGNSISLPGNVTLDLGSAGVSINSAQFRAAERACRSLAPPALFSSAR